MAHIPIRQLTLYKQGIGYFRRAGAMTGTQMVLVIPRTGTNDALKSLNVEIHAGGPLLSVDYETPEDTAALLDTLAVKVADRSSFVDILVSLRGSHITLHIDDGTTVTGRLIGLEASLGSTHPTQVLVHHDAQIQIASLDRITRVQLHDERSNQDVNFFLNVSQIEHTRTTLTLRFTEGNHDLTVDYLAPAPTWRISYRLIKISATEARLMAWGLFDQTQS